MNPRLPAQDLDFILDRSEPLFQGLKGHRFFITGGTGLIGKWILASLLAAESRWKLGLKATVLSRDPEAFLNQNPEFQGRGELQWLKGDVKTFAAPSGSFDSVLHLAGEVSTEASPAAASEATRHVAEFSRNAGAGRILFTSSGAVYGKIPSDMVRVGENYSRGASDLTAYGEGKLASERLLSIMARESAAAGQKVESKLARIFAVVGPGLPLDGRYAIGNFIRDGLRGGPIRVSGDGTPTRSYLHLAEHTLWLWTILAKGASDQPYNVGSGESYSIRQIAELCGRYFKVPVQIAGVPALGASVSRYVPDVSRIESELGLKVEIPLEAAIERTVRALKN